MVESGGELSLLDRVELYLQTHKLPASRFGLFAVGTPSLVARLRAGKTVRRRTIERVEAFLAQPVHPRRPMTQGQFKAHRYRQKVNENIQAELAEQRRRAADPHEQAAIALRQRGWRVTRARVHEAGAEGWCVGTARKSDDELLAMARRNGWRG